MRHTGPSILIRDCRYVRAQFHKQMICFYSSSSPIRPFYQEFVRDYPAEAGSMVRVGDQLAAFGKEVRKLENEFSTVVFIVLLQS